MINLNDATPAASSGYSNVTWQKDSSGNVSGQIVTPAPATRTLSTTAPLTGGGDLSADRTLAISSFTGDSGSGGAKGAVPAPASGDTAAGKFLKADGTWAVPAGTVTSVGLTVPSWLSVSGTPVTSSGTLAVTSTTGQTANSFLATPDGSTGAVGLRAIAAADLPLATTGAFGAVKPDGTTITISGGVISSTGGGGGTTVSVAAPYIVIGGTKYVASTMFPFTALYSGSWLGTAGTITTGANGDSIVSTGSTAVYYSTAASSSIETEFSLVTNVNSTTSTTPLSVGGLWAWDSTNNVLHAYWAMPNIAGAPYANLRRSTVTSYTGTGQPGADSSYVYGLLPYGGTWHFKLAVTSGTLKYMVSGNGGQTFTTWYSESVGTIAKMGIGVYQADMYVYSVVAS